VNDLGTFFPIEAFSVKGTKPLACAEALVRSVGDDGGCWRGVEAGAAMAGMKRATAWSCV